MFKVGDLIHHCESEEDVGFVVEQKDNTYGQLIKVWWPRSAFIGGWYYHHRFRLTEVDDDVQNR